jgi:8-oxo-dGTP pyrophosphatase MutT (NUDIX family)
MESPRVMFVGKHFRILHEDVESEPGQTVTFEYVERTDGARIIAVDDGKVLLTREYRHELSDYDWRLPGGRLNADEAASDAAKRELAEETGVRAEQWRFLWSTTPDSTVRYQRHFFLAERISTGEPNRDPGERLSVHWVELPDACELALSGAMREEISALSLLRLRHRIESR